MEVCLGVCMCAWALLVSVLDRIPLLTEYEGAWECVLHMRLCVCNLTLPLTLYLYLASVTIR